MTVELFDQVIAVNLRGTFLCCKSVTPVMKKQQFGKIVNIAWLGGRTGRPGVGVNYAASKAGVIGLTQTLAREFSPSGIYANAICPGQQSRPSSTQKKCSLPGMQGERFRRMDIRRTLQMRWYFWFSNKSD